MSKGKIAYIASDIKKTYVKCSKCNQYQDVSEEVELGKNIPTTVQCRNCKSIILIEEIRFQKKNMKLPIV